jgi:hypothetical protein
MKDAKLTSPTRRAHRAPMELGRAGWGSAVLLMSGVLLSGCISVSAPDEPIVIELNINISQEVVYRLAEDAGNTIEDNPDIF